MLDLHEFTFSSILGDIICLFGLSVSHSSKRKNVKRLKNSLFTSWHLNHVNKYDPAANDNQEYLQLWVWMQITIKQDDLFWCNIMNYYIIHLVCINTTWQRNKLLSLHKFFTLQCLESYIGCGILFGSCGREGSDMDGECDAQVLQRAFASLCSSLVAAEFWMGGVASNK